MMSNTSNGPRSNEPFGSASANEPFGDVAGTTLPMSSPPTRPSAIARRGAVNCFVTFAGKEWHAAPGHVVNPKPSQLKPLNGFWIASTLFRSFCVMEASSNCAGIKWVSWAGEGRRDLHK